MGSEVRPGTDQKLELKESIQIGKVISSTQGTPELVGVGKVNLNSEVRDCLSGRWSQKLSWKQGLTWNGFYLEEVVAKHPKEQEIKS